jgi:site-specific recombinase XerD
MSNLREAVDDFLTHLGEVNRSPRTVETYRRALERFLADSARSGLGPEVEVAALEPRHLRAYSRSLYRAGLSAKSRSAMLSAVRSWLRYLLRDGQAVPSPDLVEMPKIPVHVPDLDERLPETVESPPPPRDFEGERILALRDEAILQTLYSTQLRVAELCSLNADQIDPERGLAVVVGKGRKTRTVFFGPTALAAIARYLAARADRYRPLFLRHDRARQEPDPAKDPRGESLRVTERSVQKLVRRAAAARGIQATPHSFRHYGATAMVRAGMDLRAVQESLGHASVATTQIYTHVNPKRLQQDWTRYHPAAKPPPEPTTRADDASPRERD